MILSDISIKRPVFTVMVTLALMTLGLLAVGRLGVDLFPDASFPIALVTTVYPGAGPEEVERDVTRPIEEAVASINGVDEVRSYSRDSVSIVIVQFRLEIDAKEASNDVRDRVAASRAKLPRDIRDPVIQKLDPTAAPILTYVVSSARDSAETRRIVEDVIKPKLEAADGVASVVVMGGKEREIHVQPDPEKLESLGLSLVQISQQLASEGFDLPGGRVTAGPSEITVKTTGRYRSLDELRRVVLATSVNGSQVLLGEIARVEDGYKDQRTLTRLDGVDAVSFEVQKQGGANTVAIADAVYERLDELKKVLPPDVKIASAIDTSTFIRHNVEDVTRSIIFGGAMAILVIFMFMLDWRSTIISGLALPTSVVTTFFMMWWLGFSLNMMSLLGLSLAIGLLIDDAVVVRENIYRHMERGEDPVTAAQKGTSQIGLAVMATTFTIVAVFVPVAFMGGMVGKFFRQFGLTVTAAVLVSLFISFTLDPMLSARVVQAIKPGHHERLRQHRVFGPIARFYEWLDAEYRVWLGWALAHRGLVALASLVLFVGALAVTPLMGKDFMPSDDRGEFSLNLELPAGTSLAEMNRVSHLVEDRLRQNPYVRRIYATLGTNEEVNKASMRVYTAKLSERPGVKISAIQDDVRERLRGIPGLVYSVSDAQFLEGIGQERPIMLYVRGEDYGQLQSLARQALKILQNTRGVKDADMSLRPGKPEADVRVDRARAADLGVSAGVVAQTVRLALEGDVVAKFRDGDRDVDVRLQLPAERRTSPEAVGALTVPVTGRKVGASPLAQLTGPRLVRVGDVSDVDRTSGPATIERMNRQRQITLTANLLNRSLGEVVNDVQAQLDAVQRPAGYAFVFGGQAQRMSETFSNMLLALATAVAFIYFVLASQFESFIHPLTIMAALPLALVGALLALFIGDFTIGMAALIGIILLMGLVTKNAILLVDYTNEARARGKPMIDALLEAGPARLRPILMTSAAMILGMLPTAISRGEGAGFRAPMAIAVIGGVLTSTVLTLLVVPVVYTFMDRFTLQGRRARAAERKAAEKGAPEVSEEPVPKVARDGAA